MMMMVVTPQQVLVLDFVYLFIYKKQMGRYIWYFFRKRFSWLDDPPMGNFLNNVLPKVNLSKTILKWEYATTKFFDLNCHNKS